MLNNSKLYTIDKFDLKDKFNVITHYKINKVNSFAGCKNNLSDYFEILCTDITTNSERILYGSESDLLNNIIVV